jgi:hypothetical protein
MQVTEYRQSGTSPLRYRVLLRPEEIKFLMDGDKSDQEHILSKMKDLWLQLLEAKKNEGAGDWPGDS